MSIPIYQVDAFADQAFSGNPACVCLMDKQQDDQWFQNVAAEMNLSETAFVWNDDGKFLIRWFTPVTEVDLCGHATLASAHTLWETGTLASDCEAVFESRSGRLSAVRAGDQISMNFPSRPPVATDLPVGLAEGLGIKPLFVGTDKTDYMVEVESEEVIRGLTPDFGVLKSVSARGIIVTAKCESGEYDFISRFFGPAAGIDEDPVTGSAHTILTPYWAEKLGRTKMSAFQASSRGGRVSVELKGDRVLLGGNARTVFRGELLC